MEAIPVEVEAWLWKPMGVSLEGVTQLAW
jgi:hypothetical protein